MKKQVKLVILALVIVFLIGYGVYASTRPLEISTLIIEPRDAAMYFIQQGYGTRGSSITVYPLVSGEILSIEVSEGDLISGGDIISRVDVSNFELLILRSEANIAALEAQMRNLHLNETRERNSLQSSRNDLVAQLEILNARSYAAILSVGEQVNLQAAINRQLESALDWARNNYQNVEILFGVSAISRDEYELAARYVEDAEGQLEQGILALSNITAGAAGTMGSDEYFEAARAAINVQIAGIDRNLATSYVAAMEDYYLALIDSELINIAQLQRNIEDAVIRAPASGRVERLYVQDINIVSPNMPVAYITTDEEISVEVFVRTRDVVNLNLGDSVDVIFRARGNDIVIPGSIQEIGDRAEERLSPLGVAERNVKVTVEIPENNIIRDGYDVDVRFTYYSARGRMIVPRTALFNYGGSDMLWVLNSGRVEMREVVLGAELRIDTVVEAGLNFGDVVIRDANDNRLREGVAVR
ncbi:MAG: HlyD family efflux transporter periplasmic adaptor subunit [Defluviitaleaceae bacterium]|nr:HlyD family efflux transporter periplasmic adaptor subunit [Defluviitaleaceae bacterium]